VTTNTRVDYKMGFFNKINNIMIAYAFI